MKQRSIILLFLAAVAAGCDGPPRLYERERPALGPVVVSMQVIATSRTRANRAADDAFAAISQVNNLLSSYLAQSEISRLNQAGGQECHVSSQTVALLRRALEISQLTGGAFDVTAGPLIRLWKRTIETRTLPGEQELAAARRLVGYRLLVLGLNSARLTTAGMNVDLGAIAKGHAVDRAIEALRAAGIQNALVDAGGDGYALGVRLDGTPWRVGIQHPRAPTDERLPQVLLLSNMAYATSGDYSQYVEIDGVRYAHIVDPRTGQPARAAASVTVVAPDCTTADALATALSVLGPTEGLRLVETLDGVDCMIVTSGAEGLVAHMSAGFRALTAQ